MGIAAHIARLRAFAGHELLLLPSVTVLPADSAGRIMLVRHAGHDDGWGTLGGAIEPGESPAPRPRATASSASWPGSRRTSCPRSR